MFNTIYCLAFNFKIIQQSVLFILWIADINASKDIVIRLQNIFHRISTRITVICPSTSRISILLVFLLGSSATSAYCYSWLFWLQMVSALRYLLFMVDLLVIFNFIPLILFLIFFLFFFLKKSALKFANRRHRI